MLSDILKAFQWRYATKLFNPRKRLAASDLKRLLEIVRLSPSSLGLQPYKILVISNKKIRQRIVDSGACTQRKVLEAPYLLAFCTPTSFPRSFIDSFITRFRDERKMTEADVAKLRAARRKYAATTDFAQLEQWADEQAFIALGVLLSAAAMARIDAGPMGGFKVDILDSVLGLSKKKLRSRVLCSLGYRDSSDPEAKAKKVRRSFSELFTEIK